MNRFSGLRVRLVGMVLLAVVPSLAALVYAKANWIWPGACIAVLALGAAWLGSDWFVMGPVKSIQDTARKLAGGDLGSRTSLQEAATELNDLAQTMDSMAANLEQQHAEREKTEASLLTRAHQQTVIAALGQFALVTTDVSTLLNQAAMLVAQTLSVEFCKILQVMADGESLLLRAGTGWKEGLVGAATLEGDHGSQSGFTLLTGEPVVVEDLRKETRFQNSRLIWDHGAISGVTVIIQGHQKPFGVLGVHTAQSRIFNEEEVHFLLTVATLLAMAIERQRTEPEIQKLAAFAKFNPNPVLEFSSDGQLTYFNDAARTMAVSLGQQHPNAFLPEGTVGIVQMCLITGEQKLDIETRPANRILSWSFYPITASQVVHCYVVDTTERASLEDQLRQSQKMESVGQLAAGVAHDFNNILTIIQGHSGLLMSRPNLSPAMTTSIQAVSFAAERAASLTRQLLMFSRKQVMQPKPIDLKDVVSNMSKMLQRLIGETITLHCKYPTPVPPIRGDAGMMEQILMNLAVNARDAMPKGGQLTVTVDFIAVNESHVRSHPDARVGHFICLLVSDTGTGMDAATMKRIFEPFFTTKEEGRGTGLGLATVYGIVKQHAGWIEVTSRLGEGTTFKIYFPATVMEAEAQKEIVVPTTNIRGKGETILVVEDEPVLRDLAQVILQDCGYAVVQAASGVDALTVWQRISGQVDLLLTDMIMPDGLSGKDLADSLLGVKPNLKVIFTSGYNVDDLGAEFVQKNGSHFLQKPYSRVTLARAVRDCLDASLS